jgi:hypothetical protein
LKTENEDRKLAPAKMVSLIFGIVMVVLYIGLGTTIIFYPPGFLNLPGSYSTALGIMLIVYGIFRAYKIYQRYQSGPDTEL